MSAQEIILKFSIMQCSAVQFSSVMCSAIQFSYVQCRSFECSEVVCSAVYLEENALKFSTVQLSEAMSQL